MKELVEFCDKYKIADITVDLWKNIGFTPNGITFIQSDYYNYNFINVIVNETTFWMSKFII